MRLLVHGLAGYTKGGIETFIIGMAEHMSDKITFDYVIEKEGTGESVKMPGNGDTLSIEPKRHMIANLRSWKRLLNERKDLDSAIYFNWYSMAWLFPAILARVKGYRVIIHAHNNKLHNCSFAQHMLHFINRQIQRFMKITRLTNSELSARFFFGNKPAHLIYNAIDTVKFAFNESIRNRIRKDFDLVNKRVYGFAGRIDYQKNPLFLMSVFNEIKKKDDNCAFLVCGDGAMMYETKKTAADYGLTVQFVGSVSNIYDYYQAMDIFILPSRFEGLGIVLIEAQCCGLKCIASAEVIPDIAKVTDLVKFIPLKNNPEEWADHAVKASVNHNRTAYKDQIKNTSFNIDLEAQHLEELLLG